MKSQKNKTALFLFAFFLGLFGAHRFYAQRGPTAILLLLLTLSMIGFPIACVWVLIDLIIILSGTFKDKDGLSISNW